MQGLRKEVRLKIGGIGIRFHWKKATIENLDHIFYKDFIVEGLKSMDVDLRVYYGRFPEYSPERMVFDAIGNHWRLYNYDNKYLMETYSATPPHPKENIILIDKDFSLGEVCAKRLSLLKLMRPLGEILIVNHLSRGKGVLAHALGIDDQGRGIVFFGASGTGKSTLANLYKEHSKDTIIFNDERLIVRKEEDKFWLYGTPWPGTAFTAANHKVELKKVFFLEHGLENKTVSEPTISMVKRMFQQLFLPLWNKQGIDFTLRFCEELVASIPSCRLAFVNNEKVIDFVRQTQ